MREWSSRDVAHILAFRQNQSKREKRASKPAKTKKQTPEQMLSVLDKL